MEERKFALELTEKESQVLNFMFMIVSDIIQQNNYPEVKTTDQKVIFTKAEFERIYVEFDEKVNNFVHEHKLCKDPNCKYNDKKDKLKKMF